MMFGNRVLSRIFKPKNQGKEQENRKIKKMGLFALHQICDRMGETCISQREIRNAHKILLWQLQVKKLLGRLRHRWEDNIKTGLGERECQDEEFIQLVLSMVQRRALVNTVLSLRFPWKVMID
jgi:hypothetical protein